MRLFAAVPLPDDARRAIGARVEEKRGGFPRARWVKQENLHLTLAFFGEVEDDRVPQLASALREAAHATASLRLRLETAGGFPTHGRVRVVWLRVEPAEQLAELAAKLRAAARRAEFGFDDRPFASHVTLARCRQAWPSSCREELGALEPAERIAFEASRALLLASELAPGGARYREVAELPLAEAA